MSDREMRSTLPRRPGDGARRSRIVYVASNDEQIWAEVHRALENREARVRCFRSGFDYLACQRPRVESCLLIGGHLADMTGLELQRMVRHTQSPPIIFLSNQVDLASCVRAMKAGALDFLALPFVDAHLLDVMETAFKKDNAASAATLQEEELYRRWRSLTSREAEVMRYVVAGFLNKQTAGELNIAENTVQVHRGRIMRKMHADSFAALVRMSLRLEGRKEPISVPRTQTSPSFGEMWEAAALGPELSNAIGTLARTPVNSHISPKPGEIWGTHVRG